MRPAGDDLRRLVPAAIALAVLIAVVGMENVAIGTFFPHLSRVTTDFSPAYLRRELAAMAAEPPQTIFLGDSVLWGFRLKADETAISSLRARGCACRNLAFKAGSPPNYYALVRLLEANGVRPRAVVLEVNQKVLNAADPSYRTLHPALANLAYPLLTADERAALGLSPPPHGVAAWAAEEASSLSALYAMRSDIRQTLYNENDPVPIQRPDAGAYEGTYDLTPLNDTNAGVHYLTKTADALRRAGVPVVAFMTPMNHPLLREYIDNAEYRANGAYVRRLLERRGERVIDLDAAFPAAEFLDNDHLTAAGQRRLASILASALPH